jgi:hypothetical protein
MFINSEVDLPESLLDAKKNNKLLIFAGAGISAGPPSNLPIFKDLAIQIGGSQYKLSDDEPIDRFLGRLEEKGIQIRDKVSSIIGNPESLPTDLHRNIISLFLDKKSIHIVTTNFDKHFTTIIKELYGDNINIYYAPALPLGREFAGLVYLHGSIEKEKEHLILTDGDFGRAYLTDGWATQFLKSMFQGYTVLFIGYSHDDTVMRYLARGLPPGTERYAFSVEREAEKWGYLGIIPIIYPQKKGPNDHSALTSAMISWVNFAKSGLLDHNRRIKEIVSKAPPIDQEQNDYIKKYVMKNIATVRLFTQHASTPEWLEWAEKNDFLDNLFSDSDDLTDIDKEVAGWFAKNFVCDYANESLAIFQRQNISSRISYFFWYSILHALWTHEPPLEPSILKKWVSLLIGYARPYWNTWNTNILDYLLNKCRYPDDGLTALLLFEYLTTPYIALEHSFIIGDKDKPATDINIAYYGDEHWLTKAWENIFKPNLSYFAYDLIDIVTNQIKRTYRLLSAYDKVHEEWDYISLRRTAIEPHEQDHIRHVHDIIIDSARDILEWMLNNNTEKARTIIENWSQLDIPILRRLSVHGVIEDPKLESDVKIKWLIEKDWLYAIGLRHEVFRLLEKEYPGTSESTRKEIIARIEKGPSEKIPDNIEDQKHYYYSIYNLLSWLKRVDPECPHVSKALNIIQEKYPEFRPGEHPDLTSWVEVSVELKSPITCNELLQKQPAEIIDWLLEYKGDNISEPSREGLLSTISEATSKSYDWIWKIVNILKERHEWRTDIWRSIIMGWGKSSLTQEQWHDILSFLNNETSLHHYTYDIASLLEKGIESKENAIPESCILIAEDLAEKLFIKSEETESKQEEHKPTTEWLITAINHPGGIITEFWLHALAIIRQNTEKKWNGIPSKCKKYFDHMLSSKSYTSQLGRVVLSSQLHFLFYLDKKWAQKRMIPLFNWSNPEQAEQSWQGFLIWGHWNESFLHLIFPYYKQSFSRLSEELSVVARRFCEHIANISLFSSINPIENGWLWNFLIESNEDNRAYFASSISDQLKFVKEEFIEELWNSWLDNYWTQRISGYPVPLSNKEKEEMLLWIIPLKRIFPAIVDKICKSPAPRIKHTILFHELSQRNIAQEYPEPLSKLLVHLLSEASETFYYCSEIDSLVRKLADNSAPKKLLLKICNELARVGCPSAPSLEAYVNDRYPDN